ncbi:MAG TPA: hypothetical protein VFT52_11175 [Luteimonas sp.]|jgi:hypothetical protein|nr:hypothetical protein [Luteimonas sp.]
MSPAHRFSKLLAPFLPLLLMVLAGLGVIALEQASHLGSSEFWLMAWMLAFVVVLPAAMVLLAVIGALQRRRHPVPIIPNAGVKIPGAGQ